MAQDDGVDFVGAKREGRGTPPKFGTRPSGTAAIEKNTLTAYFK
jgi:hypothetical protein